MTSYPNEPKLFAREREAVLRELGQDLSAVWTKPEEQGSAESWLTAPTVLRRVAWALAEPLDAEITAILGCGPYAEILGASVSLACGRPYCWVSDADALHGSLRAGDSLAVVSVYGADLAAGAEWAGTRGAEVRRCEAVLGSGVGALFSHHEGVFISEGMNDD